MKELRNDMALGLGRTGHGAIVQLSHESVHGVGRMRHDRNKQVGRVFAPAGVAPVWAGGPDGLIEIRGHGCVQFDAVQDAHGIDGVHGQLQ